MLKKIIVLISVMLFFSGCGNDKNDTLFDAINDGDISKCNDTPLHYTAYSGHPEICELLIQHDADVNAKNDDDDTPLHIAAYWGYLNICELLIMHSANVNAKNKYRETPLDIATRKDYIEIRELLKTSLEEA